MIEEGFSSKVITPKITTSEDLEWWFREKMETVRLLSFSLFFQHKVLFDVSFELIQPLDDMSLLPFR
jgi:hypothetical protein